MTVIMKAARILTFGALCLALSLSSCKLATSGGESDLPLEEWVVTKAYVKYADGLALPYGNLIDISYSDSNSHSGSFTDDYDGKVGTDALTIFKVSSYTIPAADFSGFALTATPDPSSDPVVTFDTNHYFYRIDNSSTFRQTVAKCHFKTSSIAVTFEQ